MKIKEAVTERFKELCAERNITINSLTTQSGVTASTAYSMMNPTRQDVGIVTIKKLCDGLDITITEFFDTELFKNLEQEIE